MASKLLGSISGSGGSITKKGYPIETIAAGATGTYRTLTPPSGQKIKLTYLTCTTIQTNLTTLTIGGVDVVDSVLLTTGFGSNTSNHWAILQGANEVIGDVDEIVEFKTNVATSSDIHFMYQKVK